MKLINGAVYKGYYCQFVLVSLEHDKWGMLHIGRHIEKGMSAPMFQSDNCGTYAFTETELIQRFDADNWKMLDGRLRIEKINDMSFVEYSHGDLEEVK